MTGMLLWIAYGRSVPLSQLDHPSSTPGQSPMSGSMMERLAKAVADALG
jgi:hypothetical protein